MLRGVRVLLATTSTPDDRKTLCAARALARRGVRVSVGSDRFRGLACWSRAVAERLRYPHPGREPGPFISRLERLLDANRHDVIIPVDDYTTAAVAAHAGALAALVHMAVPGPASQARAHDKLAVVALGRELGIETPLTLRAETDDEVRQAAARIGCPCVVKFRRGSGAVGLRILQRPGDWLADDGKRAAPGLIFGGRQYLVQERVPGDTHDVCAVVCHGNMRAAMTQRRLRTYPAAAGVGIDCVTTDEPALVERAALLMRALRWHGPAQIEFKVDPASGRAWLIEINGRLWGTLALADWAGIDVPWMLCRMALDGDVEPQMGYRAGARYRWLLPLGLLHAAQSDEKWQALWGFLAPSRDTGGDWRWSDPWPHAAEAVYALQRMWSRGRFGPERRLPLEGSLP